MLGAFGDDVAHRLPQAVGGAGGAIQYAVPGIVFVVANRKALQVREGRGIEGQQAKDRYRQSDTFLERRAHALGLDFESV